ncbi:glyoxalase [Rathayibacter rathayi]|uniref:Glyoxalase n=1 Tax=Rathayibacter rathayi TaxID=33887 RepID=A0ABX5AAS0_RATRA|nr:VOC family protein [Rathayibacter rathayi]AZZ49488.1 glyoxalase [Rathayibacter rathayi]MWV73599.1 glyoxalase [Rathayibacter rathayi NCPPB 2980 = VKM Ac-1601]PPF22883.1 glyoxalase [Rathayibacter rathayi]PPF47817.1 glyoxalase [Rathayibacter rathayi]PPG67005.1 glyoxalase [Rathayibacter rathayi]
MPGFHHVELWVADLDQALAEWDPLLRLLGFSADGAWLEGRSWSAGGAYLVLTTPPALSGDRHDRRRPGVNHLAFRGGSPEQVDTIMTAAQDAGWRPLFSDRYPHAGGPQHYAGWLEDSAGHKCEIVATESETG